MSNEHRPETAPSTVDEAPPDRPRWTAGQRGSLVRLAAIEPDLGEMVEDRRQWAKFWRWVQRVTTAFAEFAKWVVIIGGAVAGLKAYLAGWLK